MDKGLLDYGKGTKREAVAKLGSEKGVSTGKIMFHEEMFEGI